MEFTVKAFASKEQVTPRTVWNWIEKGAVEIRRTPGGGVRVVDRRATLTVLELKSDEIQGNPST